MSEAISVAQASHDLQHPVRVSIVIPVYNELENIPALFSELQDSFRQHAADEWHPYEIIFVEDESDDGTSELIDEYASEHTGVTAIHLRRNWGQSAAIAAGVEASAGDIIVPMDGDGQNDPADIPRLLRRLDDGYDCVSGWRRNRHDPWHKRWPSAVQTRLAKLLGPDINDFGCTLKAYRREAITEIQLYGEGHRYIPAKLYKRGYSVSELEVNHRPRLEGESRYGVGRLIRGFVDLIYYYFDVHFSTRPMHLFGGTGLFAMGLGLVIGLLSVIQKYAFGVELAPRTPRLILTALLIIFGLQLLVFGFLAEMMTRMRYRDHPPYRVGRVVE